MKKNNLLADYWNQRYKKRNTGWDIGYAAPAILEYFHQIVDKRSKILVPGAGFGHEVAALYEMGFQNIYFMDYASEVAQEFTQKHPKFPKSQILQGDFFLLHQTFDYIVEQTFFCALLPVQRPEYVVKMSELLNKNGKLIGVLFNRIFEKDGPPFGGIIDEYKKLFQTKFTIHTLASCYNSIPQRQGNELFFIFQKKNENL